MLPETLLIRSESKASHNASTERVRCGVGTVLGQFIDSCWRQSLAANSKGQGVLSAVRKGRKHRRQAGEYGLCLAAAVPSASLCFSLFTLTDHHCQLTGPKTCSLLLNRLLASTLETVWEFRLLYEPLKWKMHTSNPDYQRMTAMWELGTQTGVQEQVLGVRSWFVREYQAAFTPLPNASDSKARASLMPFTKNGCF